MSAVFLMLGLLAGGAGAWQWVKSSEQIRFASRIRELESKIRYSQGETLALKERLTVVQAQMAAAAQTLAEERSTHAAALSAMTASFKKGLLALTAAYFTVGLVFGGTAGWFGASWRLGARQTAEKSRLEMDARLAGLQVELLGKQLEELRHSSGIFELALRSVYPQKSGDGFFLDEQKLKKNLRDKIEIESSYQDLPVLYSTPRL